MVLLAITKTWKQPRNSLVAQRFKDLASSLLWLRLRLWWGFDPWARKLRMLWAKPKRKKKCVCPTPGGWQRNWWSFKPRNTSYYTAAEMGELQLHMSLRLHRSHNIVKKTASEEYIQDNTVYVKFRNMQTRTSYCLEIGTKWNYRNNKYQIQQHRCLDEEDGIREEAEGTSVASEDSSVSQAECGYTAVHCVILPTLDKSENMYVQLIMYRLYIFYLSFQVG